MRVKRLLALFVLFGVLSANTAFAGFAELIDLELRVTRIRYENGEMREVIPNTRPSATFAEDGRVYGSAGCNRYFAAYGVSGGNIRIEPAVSTKMLCSSPRGIMEQERAFLNALESAAAIRANGGEIELLDATDEVVLALADANSEIFNQRLEGFWRVENMAGNELIPGTTIIMGFTDDGRLTGKATVNYYFTSYIESDGLILFTHTGTTMMAGPQEHMEQESVFLGLLGKVRKYKIQDNQLTLTTADGTLIMAVWAGKEM